MIEKLSMLSKLSESQQNYIEVIYDLSKEHSHAHVKNIAEEMNISMPSVTEALRSLQTLNLINHKSRHPVTLTVKGREMAEILEKRHKTFSKFFSEVLGLNNKYSENAACKIEHVIDDELWKRLLKFQEYLSKYSELSGKNIVEEFKKSITHES